MRNSQTLPPCVCRYFFRENFADAAWDIPEGLEPEQHRSTAIRTIGELFAVQIACRTLLNWTEVLGTSRIANTLPVSYSTIRSRIAAVSGIKGVFLRGLPPQLLAAALVSSLFFCEAKLTSNPKRIHTVY